MVLTTMTIVTMLVVMPAYARSQKPQWDYVDKILDIYFCKGNQYWFINTESHNIYVMLSFVRHLWCPGNIKRYKGLNLIIQALKGQRKENQVLRKCLKDDSKAFMIRCFCTQPYRLKEAVDHFVRYFKLLFCWYPETRAHSGVCKAVAYFRNMAIRVQLFRILHGINLCQHGIVKRQFDGLTTFYFFQMLAELPPIELPFNAPLVQQYFYLFGKGINCMIEFSLKTTKKPRQN